MGDSRYEDAVKWLLEKPFTDGSRMGITGSSYGGYLTCLALTKGAGYWTHGFAGSSVTDYRLYDNIYTERYMDTPQENPEGYKDGSAVEWAGNYKGMLYLNHGDMDDNVHMQNSIYLISKLQDEGKIFQFMLYPNGRHGWGGKKSCTFSKTKHTIFGLRIFSAVTMKIEYCSCAYEKIRLFLTFTEQFFLLSFFILLITA